MQVKKVLVPIDFSKRGDRALEQANLLAQQWDADLTVLHAINLRFLERVLIGDRRNQMVTDTKKQLEAHIQGCDPRTESLVEIGNPSDAIMDTARLKEADLIVVGDHGEFHLKDVVLGTTARHVIENARLPILVVKTPEHKPYRRIFLATDFSDSSKKAITLAMSLFAGAAFVIYHGYLIPSDRALTRYNLAGKEATHMLEEMHKEGQQKLDSFIADLPACEKIEPMIQPSTSPSQDILTAAQSAKADLIVMGTKGMGSFMPLMVGSVADSLLRHAQIDMLIYKN